MEQIWGTVTLSLLLAAGATVVAGLLRYAMHRLQRPETHARHA